MLTKFIAKSKFLIKLVEQSGGKEKIVFTSQVDVQKYINHDAKQQQKPIIQNNQVCTKSYKMSIEQETALQEQKQSEHINYEQILQENDIVNFLDSSAEPISAKQSQQKRKSNSSYLPIRSMVIRRLDTISQQDSFLQIAEKRDGEQTSIFSQSFRESPANRKLSQNVAEQTRKNRHQLSINPARENQDGLEYQLQKKSTWIERDYSNNPLSQADDEVYPKLKHSLSQLKLSHIISCQAKSNKQLSTDIQFKKQPIIDFGHKTSKTSKKASASEKQLEDKFIPFVAKKASLLSDLQKNQSVIELNHSVYFGIKWMLLFLIVVGLAFFVYFLTDVFQINYEHKQLSKEKDKHHRPRVKSDSQSKKTYERKNRKSLESKANN